MKEERLNHHTNNSPKINEYIQRYNNGESMESFGDIPESWKELIEKGTLVNEQKENDVNLSNYPMIPSKWQCLISQPDLLEEMWTFAIPIDEKEYETLKAWKKRGVDYAKAQIEKGEKVPEPGTKEVISPEVTPPESEIFGTGIEREIKLPSLERKQTIHAIGDLNGSYKSFIDHLKSQNLISMEQGDPAWVGGNSKAVFIGDILGDRSPDGMRIYERLQELQNQAKLQGGTIEWLSGNHENMFNAILCGFSTEKGKKVEEDMSYRMSGYTGNLELLKLLPIESLQGLYTTIATEKDTVFGSDFEVYIQKKKRTLQSVENNPETLPETVAAYKKGYQELLNKKNYLDSFCSLVESQNYEEAQKSLFTFIDTLDKKYQNQIGKLIIENRSLLK